MTEQSGRVTSWELWCPTCGALVEGETADEACTSAVLHCRDAHRYELPLEHARGALTAVST